MSTAAIIPLEDPREAARIAALDRYDPRPLERDAGYDGIVRLAALLFRVPVAAVSMVGADQVFCKSVVGMAGGTVPRHGTFCASAVESDVPTIVSDASMDPRFRDHPAVRVEGIRFYAGAPICTPDGERVGTLCVMQPEPRAVSPAECEALVALAAQASIHLAIQYRGVAMHHQAVLLSLAKMDLSEVDSALRRIVDTAAEVLGVSRVSLWLFEGEDRETLHARDILLPREGVRQAGLRVSLSEYPRYFRLLSESRVLALHDAVADPRSAEYAEAYLRPLGVASMLNVPIRADGRMIGVLCCEQELRPRTWSLDEQEFVASLTDLAGTALEVSRRREVEASLRSLAASLERRVEERTAELAASNHDLARAVNDLEAFCYSVSHDLRAPLRVINGFAAMVADSPAVAADGDAADGLQRIRDNTSRMAALLDDLLSFFRLGRRRAVPTTVDMDEVFAEVLETLGVDGDPGRWSRGSLGSVVGDRGLLLLALTNLLANAFKFSARQEAPRVEVWREEAGDGVALVVRDNGVGFPMAHAQHLFEPFQRLHAGEGYEGTGVGLAIVRRVAEQHGGHIHAESAPGEGATFRLWLPAAWPQPLLRNPSAGPG